jgi:hypothetical protein
MLSIITLVKRYCYADFCITFIVMLSGLILGSYSKGRLLVNYSLRKLAKRKLKLYSYLNDGKKARAFVHGNFFVLALYLGPRLNIAVLGHREAET